MSQAAIVPAVPQVNLFEKELSMIKSTIVIALSYAIATAGLNPLAGRDGSELLHQAQTLERIKQAASWEPHTETHRLRLGSWDSPRRN